MFFLDRINGIVRIWTMHINPISRVNAVKNLHGTRPIYRVASVRKVVEAPVGAPGSHLKY